MPGAYKLQHLRMSIVYIVQHLHMPNVHILQHLHMSGVYIQLSHRNVRTKNTICMKQQFILGGVSNVKK